MRLGVVGLGYWGPNLRATSACSTAASCAGAATSNADARETLGRSFPQARFTDALEELLEDAELDAIVIATHVPSHAPLALRVLDAGKHCFVEKPLAQSAEEARRGGSGGGIRPNPDGRASARVPPRRAKLKELLDAGELGDLHYMYSKRLNLGKIREDENALWSLGAHDVSVVLHLLDGIEPEEVLAHGEASSATESRTSSSATCDFHRARSRISTSRGSTRTRSASSPSSAPSGWRHSTTWRSSAR